MSELNDLIIRSDTNEKEAVHAMKSETEVRLMLQLRGRGVTTYEIARVLACSRNTVYRYLRQGGWQSSKSDAVDGSRVVAGGAVRASRRQRRRDPPGVAHGTGYRGVVAHGGTGGATAAPSAAGTPVGDAAFRDAAGGSVAGGFRSDAGDGGWPAHDGASVRGDAGLFPPAVRGGVRESVPAVVAGRHGTRLPALRRGAAHRADGQSQSAGDATAGTRSRAHVQ